MAIIQVNPRYPVPPVKNWRILLVQSFTARMPFLTATSAFGLGRRRWSSPQQCYLHCLCTVLVIRDSRWLLLWPWLARAKYTSAELHSRPTPATLLITTTQVRQSQLQPFNGLFSRTTWVSRYQKGTTNLDFTGASKRQWVAVASAGPYASLHLAPDR